jgi:hypothetical protein
MGFRRVESSLALALIPAFAAEESRWPLQPQASIAVSRTIALQYVSLPSNNFTSVHYSTGTLATVPYIESTINHDNHQAAATQTYTLRLVPRQSTEKKHKIEASRDGVDHDQRNVATARAAETTAARRRRSRTAVDIHRRRAATGAIHNRWNARRGRTDTATEGCRLHIASRHDAQATTNDA